MPNYTPTPWPTNRNARYTMIVCTIETLPEGAGIELPGIPPIQLWKHNGKWWTQAGGGVQFSRSASRAFDKARALIWAQHCNAGRVSKRK